MRILFISNFFPPVVHGGHEVECQEVRQVFASRGHQTAVLTSAIDVEPAADENENIFRWLSLEMPIRPWKNSLYLLRGIHDRRKKNQGALKRLVDRFKPDIIFIWGMWNLHESIAKTAENLMGTKVLYRMADYWPTLPDQATVYWQGTAEKGPKRWIKSGLRKIAQRELDRPGDDYNAGSLKFPHVITVSQAVKRILLENKIPVENARVIYPGIHVQEFFYQREWPQSFTKNNPLKLLHAGRLSIEKGTDTVIWAFAEFQNHHDGYQAELTIVGGSGKADREFLQGIIQSHNLADKLNWLAKVPREEIPQIMSQNHAFIFASTWEEPFSRVILEAMAAGMLVIGTNTGGTGEILIDLETGLSFEAGDVNGLAKKIIFVLENRELAAQMADRAQKRILADFEFNKQINRIESYMCEILANS